MNKPLKVKGKVIRVLDGDTIEVAVKVRLKRIDAPEITGIESAMGDISHEWLEKRVDGKSIMLDIYANDIYYRLISEVFHKEVNIGEEMLTLKLAEVYSPKRHNDGKLDV